MIVSPGMIVHSAKQRSNRKHVSHDVDGGLVWLIAGPRLRSLEGCHPTTYESFITNRLLFFFFRKVLNTELTSQ